MRKLFPAIAGMLLFSVAAVQPFTAAAQQPQTLTVGIAPSIDMSLLIVAVNKGFLEKEGVKAQLQLFDSAPAALQGVVAGRADITENTEPPQLGARARGGKIVQIMTGYLSGKQNGIVVNGKLVSKPQDFVGKSVAVQKGSGANYHLAWYLERHKIAADKVNVRYMDAPDQIAALARGDVQGFFSWEPYLTKAATSVPDAKLYERSMDDGLVFGGSVVMREDLAKGNKEFAVKVVKGLIAAADWITANPRDAAKVVNAVVHAPSDDVVYEQLRALDWPGTFKKEAVAQELRIAEWGASTGLFPTKNAKQLVDELVYPAIIKEAAPSRTDL